MHDILAVFRRISDRLTAPGMPFAMEEIMANGRNARCFLKAARCLNDIYADILARHGDKIMLFEGGRRWTYAEIFGAADRLATVLKEHHGIVAGDRVGIAMRNRHEWFIAFLAVTRMGAIAALLNSRGSGDELAYAVEKTGCRLVIADAQRAERLSAASGVALPDLAELMREARSAAPSLPQTNMDADAPALILFTSGTTGRSKGATLTQRNLCNMVHLSLYSGALNLEMKAESLGVDPDLLRAKAPPVSLLMIVPLFHISGVVSLFVAASAGGMMTLMQRWNSEEALELIEQNGISSITGPSLVMSDLLAGEKAAERMKSVRNLTVGGQASPIGLSQRIRESLPWVSQSNGWGMTEVTGSATSAAGEIFDIFAGSVGLAQPIIDLRVMAADDRPAAPDEVGEIQLRGGMVMQGYWNDEAATREAFSDGWYRTGDLGYLTEDGVLYIVDRHKDMVISAGENIYCAEVERVLQATASFAEVALFGVPDERLGERAIAAVALHEGQMLDENDVKAIVRAQLADYKVPAEVRFDLAPLPRNAVDKVDKVALRALYIERLGAS